MKKHSDQIFFLVIIGLLPLLASSLNFGDRCLKNPDNCNRDLNLLCTETSPAIFVCTCDSISFISPTLPNTCLKYCAHPGEYCEAETAQCKDVEGTACVPDDNGNGNYKCSCQETSDYFEFPLGEKCSKYSEDLHDNCELMGPGNAFCRRIEGSFCSDVIGSSYPQCICDQSQDYFENTDTNSCLKYCVHPREQCVIGTEQCDHVVGSTCITNETGVSQCICQEENDYFEYPLGEKCSKYTENLHEICIIEPEDQFCKNIEGSVCSDAGGTTNPECICDTLQNYFENPDTNSCLKYCDKPRDVCVAGTEQCNKITGTDCTADDGVNFECRCQESLNYFEYPQGERCTKYRDNLHEDCEIEPDNKFCSKIGGSVCFTYEGKTECICDASEDFFENGDTNSCLKYNKHPGDPCELGTDQCKQIEGTECSLVNGGQSICACKEELNYFEYPFGEKCTKYRTNLHEDCEVEPGNLFCQKITGTHCSIPFGGSTPECICDPNSNYFENSNTSVCLKYSDKPGEECELGTEQCSKIDGADCSASGNETPLCKCQEDLDYFEYPLGEKCSKYAQSLHDECLMEAGNQFCSKIEGSICSDVHGPLNAKCVCDSSSNYFENAETNTCLKFALRINDYCDPTTRQCELLPNTVCSNRDGISFRCVCDTDYFEDTIEQICEPLPYIPSSKCLVDEHCVNVPNSVCECHVGTRLNCTCDCEPNFDVSLDGSHCIRRAALVNDVCESDAQCANLENTICLALSDGIKRCVCKDSNFIPAFTQLACYPIVDSIGGSCEDDAQCQVILGSYASCDDTGFCSCDAGSIPNSLLNQCLPMSNINEPCLEAPQCTGVLGPESYCDQTCKCRTNTGFLNGICHKMIPLNYPCSSPEECILQNGDHSSCIGGSCECLTSAIQSSDKCYPYKLIGDPCRNWDECFVTIPGGASCSYGRCVCDYPASPTLNKTACSSGYKYFASFPILAFSAITVIVAYL